MKYQLRGGATTRSPLLDRIPQFDPRSRRFQVRDVLTSEEQERPPRSFTWNVGVGLDQESEGACVGFAWAHELAARPVRVHVTNDLARSIYREARRVDEWAGEDYEGTSVLAGAKVVTGMGHFDEYRWAGAGSGTALDDLVRAIAYKGPAALGINWYTGMFSPESDGRLRPTGVVEGGHAILAYRVTGPAWRPHYQRHRIYLWNSWGRRGRWPIGWLTWEDAERLLHEQGEACIPMMRRKVTT